MSDYAAAVARGDCSTAGQHTVSGSDGNCESRPDHYSSPGFFKIGRIVEVDEYRANVELIYRCSDCTSDAGGFVRAVNKDGKWLIDSAYNGGSFIDDDEAVEGKG